MNAWKVGCTALLSFAAAGLGAEPHGIDVEWIVSSNTFEWPEAQVLIRNHSSEEIVFFVHPAKHPLMCGSEPKAERYELRLQGQVWTRQRDAHYGTVPGGGWNHRSFRLGADPELRAHLPCRLRAVVSISRDFEHIGNVETIVEIPATRIPANWEYPEPDTLVQGWLVEDTESLDDRVTVRILLDNPRDHGVVLEELDRWIECAGGERLARWDLGTRVVQGERGPLYIEPHSWGVLLESVLIDDTRGHDECVAILELGVGQAIKGGGARRFDTVRVPLKPTAKGWSSAIE